MENVKQFPPYPYETRLEDGSARASNSETLESPVGSTIEHELHVQSAAKASSRAVDECAVRTLMNTASML